MNDLVLKFNAKAQFTAHTVGKTRRGHDSMNFDTTCKYGIVTGLGNFPLTNCLLMRS